MGNVTTSATVDTLALSYTTGHAPLTIIGPDADGNTVIESSALSADDLATAIDIAGRTAITDNGDGTGTRTVYDVDGKVVSTEQVTGLPIPEAEPVEITLADVAAALRDPLANLTDSSESTTVRTAILNQRAALDALLAALETPRPIQHKRS